MTPPDKAHRNTLLEKLSQADREAFFSGMDRVALPQRLVLYEVGGRIDHVYFLEEGLASILAIMADGASVEVGMTGFEGMVGVPYLLGNPIAPQRIVMQLPGSGLRMPAAACKAAFDASPTVRSLLMGYVEALMNLAAQTSACNRLHSARQRCARWLIMSSDRTRSNVLPLTHEYLSAMIGVRRAGVSEIAGEFQAEGLIEYRNGTITILDREGLAEAGCECSIHDREQLEFS